MTGTFGPKWKSNEFCHFDVAGEIYQQRDNFVQFFKIMIYIL